MNNEIKLKITIDSKEAIASLQLTDENIKELYKSFKFGKQEVNGFTTQLSMGFNNAREIFQGFNEVVRVFQSTFGRSIELYGIQEQAEKQLATALGHTSQALLDYASAMQKRTIHGDEEIIQAQSLIASFVKEEGKIKLLTKATLDLADAKGMDLRTAADLITKSFASSTNALSRYGIEIKGAANSSERFESLINSVTKAFGGQAEALAQTNIGAMKQFGNLTGDVQERMGFFVLEGLNPVIEHIKYLITSLDNLSPTISGAALTAGSLISAFALLRTLGLTPLIRQMFLTKTAMEQGITTTMRAALADAGLTTANLTLSSSFKALGIAIKSSFGWFGIALTLGTTLIEVLGLIGSNSEETKNSIEGLNDAFAKRTLKDLENELESVKGAVDSTRKSLQGVREDYKSYARIGSSLDVLNRKKQELEQAQKNYNSVVEYEKQLTDAIAKKREEIKDSITASYERLSEKLEVETQKTDTAKQLKRLEITYEHEERILQEAYNTKIIDYKTYEEKLTQLTQIYQQKRDKIISEGAKKNAHGLLADINKQIKELQSKRMFAKSVEELASIDKKITELKSRKEEIELKVKLLVEGKTEINADALFPEGLEVPPVKMPVEIKPVATAEEFDELQQMKFESIQNESERESAYLDAQYQADLERYKNVIGAKEILDEYYHQRKRELEKQTAEKQIQASIDALNFIAGAVNQYTAVGKGIAVANAIWNTYQAATKTMASVPYPFNIPLVVAVTAAGFANVQKIIEAEPPKMPRFAEGGRLPKGEAGFVEGWYNELIIPEKTFVEVFQQELRPKIYSQIAVESQRNEIRELRKALENRPVEVEVAINKVASRQIVKVGQSEINKEGF